MRRPVHGAADGGDEEEANRVPSLCADPDEAPEPDKLFIYVV